MGTRHRAAIGITEESDAISVVVSEETGAISLAVGGAIERNIDAEQLRQRLSQLLSRYVPQAALPTPISDNTLGNGEHDFEPFVPEQDFREGTER